MDLKRKANLTAHRLALVFEKTLSGLLKAKMISMVKAGASAEEASDFLRNLTLTEILNREVPISAGHGGMAQNDGVDRSVRA